MLAHFFPCRSKFFTGYFMGDEVHSAPIPFTQNEFILKGCLWPLCIFFWYNMESAICMRLLVRLFLGLCHNLNPISPTGITGMDKAGFFCITLCNGSNVCLHIYSFWQNMLSEKLTGVWIRRRERYNKGRAAFTSFLLAPSAYETQNVDLTGSVFWLSYARAQCVLTFYIPRTREKCQKQHTLCSVLPENF